MKQKQQNKPDSDSYKINKIFLGSISTCLLILNTVKAVVGPCKMLSSLIKEHQTKQAAKRVVQEQKRKECIVAANDLTQALVDHLNVGVAQAYLNQKKLDAEAKLLHQGAINFSKQTQQWLALVENFSSALKEIGDVENWARSIENDMKIVTDTLENAYKITQEQPSNSK